MSFNPLGQFGSTFQAPQSGTFSTLALRDSTDDIEGKTWVIHLNGWQVTGNPNGNDRTGTKAKVSASVLFGTAGANETLTIDYPQQGTSFCVQGQQLAVTLIGSGPGIGSVASPPLLSTHMTVDATGASARAMTATFTEPTTPISQGPTNNNAIFHPPTRARSYRLFWIAPVGGSLVFMSQLDAEATVLATDVDNGQNVVLSQPAARAAWYPLHPLTTELLVANQSNTVPITIGLQWLLETSG